MVLVMIIVNVIFENIYFILSALFQTSSSSYYISKSIRSLTVIFIFKVYNEEELLLQLHILPNPNSTPKSIILLLYLDFLQ